MMPLGKRGRPRKDNSAGSSSRTIPRNQRGSVTNGNRMPSPGRMDKKGANTVQDAVQSQYDKEVKYWRDLLTRIVSDVNILSARGLPFRGDDQHTAWIYNKRAFLGMP
ncbi:hypothetical protein TNCV_84921 [Trichonephila clavipes]|nr:hypothetical protein TNCV_84921 [Trichonephila clavipes]